MTRSSLTPILLGLVAVLFAMLAGYQIVVGGVIRSLELMLAPALVVGVLLTFRYPQILGFVMIAVYFSNVDAVISYKMEARTAAFFMIMAGIYFGVLIITRSKRPPIGLPCKLYFAFFIVVASVAALLPENNTTAYSDWVRSTIYCLTAFLVTYLVISDPKRLRQVAGVITLTAVAVSVLNIIEFFDRSIVDLSAVQGRSASTLANANASAACILLGYVISYLAPLRFLLVLRIILFIGMYTTFSRAALLLFLGFGFYLEFLVQRLTFRRLMVSVMLFCGVAAISTYSSFFLEASRNRQVAYAHNRIVAASEGRFDDDSSVQRLRVIRINLERFLEKPLAGGRLGRSLDDDSPHNQILFIMSEHGAIGLFLFAAFIWSLVRALMRMQPGVERRVLVSAFGFQVANMFFTHNQYHFRFYIMNYAFIAAGAEILARRSAAREMKPAQSLPAAPVPSLPAASVPSLPARVGA